MELESNKLYNTSKGVIGFSYKGSNFMACWGSDLTDNENDKFLINEESKILLFRNTESLISYILDVSNFCFDNVNLRKWVKNLTKPELIYDFDIDLILKYLELPTNRLLDKSVSNKLIDLLNLFGDYSFQTKEETLITMFRTEIVQRYIDYNYDHYFWKVQNCELKSAGKIDFKDLNTSLFSIKSLIENRIKVV